KIREFSADDKPFASNDQETKGENAVGFTYVHHVRHNRNFYCPPDADREINIQKGNNREMKTLAIRTIQLLALLMALALPAIAEESKRGFYEGDLAGGGKIVFFVQGNHAISAYFFDVSGQQSGFAGGGAG